MEIFTFPVVRAVYGTAQYQHWYHSLKITTGENLQTSNIGNKKWKQGMNFSFSASLFLEIFNETY